ncbi:hypothetical protein HYW75_06220 [Candidatus Pacearchaeota archaeon]|nr:hypothetical protein [Candidatus Pacearchaeota archaeon]
MATDMVNEEIVNLLAKIGTLGSWLQAIGIVILLTIIFQIIAFILNRKKLRELEKIREELSRVKNKLDKLLKKR